jgi:hypothetical protein
MDGKIKKILNIVVVVVVVLGCSTSLECWAISAAFGRPFHRHPRPVPTAVWSGSVERAQRGHSTIPHSEDRAHHLACNRVPASNAERFFRWRLWPPIQILVKQWTSPDSPATNLC